MNCAKCNERMDVNSVFCPNCGEKVVERASANVNDGGTNTSGGATATVVKEKKKPNVNLNLIIPIAIAAVLLIAVLAMFGSGGKPEKVVHSFFKSIEKVDPDMMLKSLSGRLKNEALDDVGWDKSELAYELSEMKEDFNYEYGNDWLKQVKISSDYKDKNSAVVGVFMFGQNRKIRLMKEGKKWVIMEFPYF